MAKTIKFGPIPTGRDIEWFVKNIGPRNHYTKYSIGGEGWCFTYEQDNPWSKQDWNLTVDDEKMLTYYLLTH